MLATDHNDNKPTYSDYGQTTVDIGAPGGTDDTQNSYNIYSTKRGDDYRYLYGTSMATPHVSGVAALAWGKRYQLTPSQIRTRIINKRDYKSSLQNKCVANGRLNAYKVLYDSASPNGTPINLSGSPSAWEIIDLSWHDNSSNEIGFEIQRKKTGEASFSYIKSVDNNVTLYDDTTATGGIAIYYKVRAYNMAGNSSFSNTLTVTIPATIPAAPTDLYAPSPSPEFHVELTWTDNANNEKYYVVERRPLGSGIWTQVGMSGQNSTYSYGYSGSSRHL